MRSTFRMRRLLILPAFILLALGGPVLATESPAPPEATSTETPVAAPDQTVAPGWTSATTPIDGELVGVTWEGDPAAEFSVQVQSTDGSWSEATAVDAETEPDVGTQDAANVVAQPDQASEPVWIGDDVTAVRVSLDSGIAADVSVTAVDGGEATVPSGSAAAYGLISTTSTTSRYAFGAALLVLAALLVAFSLGWSPWRSKRLRALMTVGVATVLLAGCLGVGVPNGAVAPTLYTRDLWAARPFGTGPVPCPGGPEYASSLKFAVVHHTVNSNNYSHAQVPAMLRSIQAYHMDANGYCDIAYNFVIDRFGWIWEARAGGMDRPVIGGHTGGFNGSSVGIALLGDHTNSAVTEPAYNSLLHLLRWRLSIARVDPALGAIHTIAASPCNCMRWPAGTTIFLNNAIMTHRDLDFTSCPGNKMYSLLGQLRTHVQNGIVFPPTTTTSTSTTSTTVPSTTSTS